MQHALYSVETTSTICAAALGIGITPLVRVPSHEARWMSRVLNGGVQGVIVPDVNTHAQAGAIVNACRFPPLGKRSVMGLGPALGYRAVPLAELNPKLNAETAVIVMLETAEGVENCEAIAAVDGVDVLLIGSGDLKRTSASLARSITRSFAQLTSGWRPRAAYIKRCSASAAFATTPICRANLSGLEHGS